MKPSTMKKLIIGAVNRPINRIIKYNRLSGGTNINATWSIVIASTAIYFMAVAERIFLFKISPAFYAFFRTCLHKKKVI